MKRYNPAIYADAAGEMYEHESGEWVNYKDVADLQRQLAEREAELAALVHPMDLANYRGEK